MVMKYGRFNLINDRKKGERISQFDSKRIMKQFYTQKYSKIPILYLVVFYCLYYVLYFFGITEIDFEALLFPFVFTTFMPILVYFNSTNISVKFDKEYIEIIDHKNINNSKIIFYTDILEIGAKDKFEQGIYAITNDEEYSLPSNIDDPIGMYEELIRLADKDFIINQNILTILTKWYVKTTRFRRFSVFISLLITFNFNYIFFTLDSVYYYFVFGVSVLVFISYFFIDSLIIRIINRQKDLISVSKVIYKYNKTPVFLSTLIIGSQILLLLILIIL